VNLPIASEYTLFIIFYGKSPFSPHLMRFRPFSSPFPIFSTDSSCLVEQIGACCIPSSSSQMLYRCGKTKPLNIMTMSLRFLPALLLRFTFAIPLSAGRNASQSIRALSATSLSFSSIFLQAIFKVKKACLQHDFIAVCEFSIL
jgi:hypothetical protein